MCEQSGYESCATPRLVPAQCVKPPGAFPLPHWVPELKSGNAWARLHARRFLSPLGNSERLVDRKGRDP